jgi:hypothetical protein
MSAGRVNGTIRGGVKELKRIEVEPGEKKDHFCASEIFGRNFDCFSVSYEGMSAYFF